MQPNLEVEGLESGDMCFTGMIMLFGVVEQHIKLKSPWSQLVNVAQLRSID